VRIGGKSVNHRVVDAVWGFFSLYVASFTFMYLLLAATGLDLMTAFSAVAACINNLGPGWARSAPITGRPGILCDSGEMDPGATASPCSLGRGDWRSSPCWCC
jgi:Trk-type K+ transport system membrane component